MGSEWRQATLGDLCTFLAGSAFAKKYQGGTKGDYPFIKVSDMKLAGNERFINDANNWISESTREKIGAKLHPKNSIAFAKIGVALTYNRRRVLTLSTILDNNMMSAIPNTDVVHSLYFYYLLTTIDFNEVVCGTSLPYLRVDDLKKIEILLPPISEQLAIAYILGSLDDKIELNRKMNQTLEAIARAIFKSWFIDFDPVIDNALRAGNPIPDSMAERAEIRRQMLDENQPSSSSPLSQKAKDRKYRGSFNFSGLVEVSIDEIHGLFPDSFQDSELGEIPRGWEVGKLDDFAILKTITIQPSAKPEKIWEYYSIPAFDEGKQPIWEVGKNIKSGKYTVPKHSVLASKLNPQFPRVWLPDVKDIDSSICSTEFMPFVPIVERWRTYLYEMLKSQTIQSEIISRITGSTGSRQRVKPKDIAILPSLFPSKKLVDFFCKLVGPLHDNLLSNIQQSAVLTSLRDALLPKLISGELCIQDTEKFLKEAGV